VDGVGERVLKIIKEFFCIMDTKFSHVACSRLYQFFNLKLNCWNSCYRY